MAYHTNVMVVSCEDEIEKTREWVRRLSGSTSWVLKGTDMSSYRPILRRSSTFNARMSEDMSAISEETSSDTTETNDSAIEDDGPLTPPEIDTQELLNQEAKGADAKLMDFESITEKTFAETQQSSENISVTNGSEATDTPNNGLQAISEDSSAVDLKKDDVKDEKPLDINQNSIDVAVQGRPRKTKQKKSRRALYKQKNTEETPSSILAPEIVKQVELTDTKDAIIESIAEQVPITAKRHASQPSEPEPVTQVQDQPTEPVTLDPEEEISQIAENVMDVLESYFWKPEDGSGYGRAHWPGRTKFKEHAIHWIKLNEPIRMCLPAFPFKSGNLDKVTGTLPDFAEYLALSRLNQLCIDVRKVYARGGEVTIATDGVAFCDLFFITPKDCWEYGQTVAQIVRDNFFDNNLVVRHSMEVLGFVKPDEITEENFYRTVGDCQQLIKDQFCQPEEAIRKLVEEDPDTCMTYTGFKTFCKVDLMNSELRKSMPSRKAYLREMSKMATRMMARSEGFGYLIRDVMPNHIRLSMHPSSGLAKLSICMVPQRPGSTSRAPWMSCIAVTKTGEYQTVHVKDVRDTHELIYMNGRPWLYRERSDLYQLRHPEPEATPWAIEHLYPSGLRVWPASAQNRTSEKNSDDTIRAKLQELAVWQPVEVVRHPATRGCICT